MGIIRFFSVFGLPLIIIAAVVTARSRYQNRSNAGAFFFENGSLVLNTGIPYAVPLDEIDRVEPRYNSHTLESSLSYGLAVTVVREKRNNKAGAL